VTELMIFVSVVVSILVGLTILVLTLQYDLQRRLSRLEAKFEIICRALNLGGRRREDQKVQG